MSARQGTRALATASSSSHTPEERYCSSCIAKATSARYAGAIHIASSVKACQAASIPLAFPRYPSRGFPPEHP
jgi:hypothetical protein